MLTEKIKLEADETILTQVRKHWFIIFGQLFWLVFAIFLPALFYNTLSNISALQLLIDLFQRIPGNVIVFGYAVWVLLLWMGIFTVWTNYYLDVWTITNKRLIAIDQHGLFHRETASFRLERLQDMNVEINGIIATFLDYGILEAQTAGGDDDKFRATGLPHPRELKSLILEASDVLLDEYKTPAHISGT